MLPLTSPLLSTFGSKQPIPIPMPRPVRQTALISVDVAIRELQQKQLVCSRLKGELETAIEDLEQARRKRHDCESTLEGDTAARASKAREGFYTSTDTPPSSVRADCQARTHYISPDTHLIAVESLANDKLGARMISDLQDAKSEVTSAMVVLGQKRSQLPARERELRRYETVVGDTYRRLKK